MKRIQQGFTLIELMIVIAIIGILAAIAIPQYQTYIAKSQVTRVMGETGGVKTAIELCVLDGKTGYGNGGVAGSNCDPGATPSTVQAGVSGFNTAYAPAAGTASGSILTLPTGTGIPTASVLGTFPLTIIASFGNSASSDLKVTPSTLTWSRDVAGTWTCTSTAASKYRPAAC